MSGDNLRDRVLAAVHERGPITANRVVTVVCGRRADVPAILRDADGIERTPRGWIASTAREGGSGAQGTGSAAADAPTPSAVPSGLPGARDAGNASTVVRRPALPRATNTMRFTAPCPDPLVCQFRMRHANGPWTCAYNHPQNTGTGTGASR
jgi:hypothetical protein